MGPFGDAVLGTVRGGAAGAPGSGSPAGHSVACGSRGRGRVAPAPPTALRSPAALPQAFDWRNVGGDDWVTPVGDQGECGTSVAFGSIAALESHVRLAMSDPNLRVDLSEADLFFCWGPAHGAG